MTESTPASILDGLALEVVEWLPSGAEGGLVRVRGRWGVGVAALEGLPVLCVSVGGGEPSRFESLPDAPSARNGSVWRGAYLVPESLVRGGALWLALTVINGAVGVVHAGQPLGSEIAIGSAVFGVPMAALVLFMVLSAES